MPFLIWNTANEASVVWQKFSIYMVSIEKMISECIKNAQKLVEIGYLSTVLI